MAMPRTPRPLCAFCRVTRVQFPGCRHCSRECFDAAVQAQKLARRPKCAMCPRTVKDPRCKYCSPRCAGTAKRQAFEATQPLCAYCEEKRVKKSGTEFCGKSCAMRARLERPGFKAQVLKGVAIAQRTHRAKYFDRVRRHFEACYAPLFAKHPEWSAEVRVEILRAAVPVYERAYRNGSRWRSAQERRLA